MHSCAIGLQSPICWVLTSSLFFTCVNSLSRYFIPEVLCVKKHWKWRNIMCSLVHSLITGVWSLLCFCIHPEMAEDMISTYSTFSHALVCISVGYFVQDFLDMMVYNRNRQTYELMGHHFVVVLCFGVAALTCQYIGYAVVALIVEVNSIFLHTRQLMQLLHLNKCNSWFRLNSLINIGTFMVFRILTLAWMTRWLVIHRDAVPLPMYTLGSVGMAIMTIMNIVLFGRVLNKDFFSNNNKATDDGLFRERVD